MKKYFFILPIIASLPLAFADSAYNADVLINNPAHDELLIDWKGDMYLLHHDCPELGEPDTVLISLTTEDIPTSYGSKIMGESGECNIKDARQVTDRITVKSKVASDQVLVADESKNEWLITHGFGCSTIGTAFKGRTVYLDKAGIFIEKGDIIYLADNAGSCEITAASFVSGKLPATPTPTPNPDDPENWVFNTPLPTATVTPTPKATPVKTPKPTATATPAPTPKPQTFRQYILASISECKTPDRNAFRSCLKAQVKAWFKAKRS